MIALLMHYNILNSFLYIPRRLLQLLLVCVSTNYFRPEFFQYNVVLNLSDVLFRQLLLHFMVQLFWDVQLYRLVNSNRHCGQAYCFHLQDQAL